LLSALLFIPVSILKTHFFKAIEYDMVNSTRPMDRAFIALLGLCGASGMALLAARSGPALPLTLAIHLGAVMAFFLTLPYGKFAHAPYRVAALLKFAVEKRMPSRLRLGSD
jgi:citrate/tricarballylate utilization protein